MRSFREQVLLASHKKNEAAHYESLTPLIKGALVKKRSGGVSPKKLICNTVFFFRSIYETPNGYVTIL